MAHRFGGPWTLEKLLKVRLYLQAYVTALKNQDFKLIYVDAFAGTGFVAGQESQSEQSVLSGFEESEAVEFIAGSAKNALEVEPPFDEYIFIEKSSSRLAELADLRLQHTKIAQRIRIEPGDANAVLKDFCNKDWRSSRAVVFLDPYGMQVRWETIELLARTRAIDVWILFPLGVAVNRLLRKDGNISDATKRTLDEMFGSEDWFSEFFKPKEVVGLFETLTVLEKSANLDAIAEYFNDRLSSVFAAVSRHPRKLVNSKNNPLYLLCFAVGNPEPKAVGLAMKLADHILKMK
jgi:three-Cys-motif partner protein